MLGRTPPHVSVIKPLIDGVISDFEIAEELVGYLISRAEQHSRKPLGPRVVVGVPSGITNVETRAVRDAARSAGARAVHIVEEPMAAALGIRLPVREPVGSMVVDIGGGTTDIAVISLGGIVTARNIRVAGEKLNSDIVGYVRDEFKMLIGEKTAEELKIAIGTVRENEHERTEAPVRGRDLMTGLPREMMMTASDVREAIAPSIETIIEATKETLEATPPEVLSDVMRRGMYLVGGGALLRGLSELFEEWLKIPVHVVDDPLTAVARGTGVILEDIAAHEDMLVPSDDALPPQ